MCKINKQLKKIHFILLFFQGIVFSQELPPVNIYNERDYNAENQNWSISQSSNGYVYVANNKGLLEFDGGDWVLYETPNETIMRSVKVIGNTIFTGFYMDFGFWKKNSFGQLEFTSLVDETETKMLEDEQIWEIESLQEYLLFKSLNRIYVYNTRTKAIDIISSNNKLNKLSQLRGVFYFQIDKEGLFKIENGTAKLISDDKVFKENTVVELFDVNGKILFLTQKTGFYFFNDKGVTPWKIPSRNLLKGKTIYSAKQLKNNDFILGSISNGVINLNEDGKCNYQINQYSGLSNNTILSIFEDKDSNIWLGLDKGVNCINNGSPFLMYKDRNKFSGTVYTAVLFKGVIYLGTNQGLFYKPQDSEGSFTFVNETQGQVWSLQVIDDTLFCGHDSGTLIVEKDTASSIFNTTGVWKLLKISENKILQGSYDGLYLLKKTNNTWKPQNKIRGFTNSSKFLEMINDSTLFVNHEYKGVFKIGLDKNLTAVNTVTKIPSAKKGIHSSIVTYQNRLLYATKDGVFVYNEKENQFLIDSLYSQLIEKNNFISARMIKDRKNNRLWFFSKNKIHYLNPGNFSNQPEIRSISISEKIEKGASGYENILPLNDSKYLIGVTNGYVTLDLQTYKEPENFIVTINKVSSAKRNDLEEKMNLSNDTILKFENNNLSFSYSVPNFNKVATTAYQYKLEGLNEKWSALSEDNKVVFENIPFGAYTFKVRAQIGNNFSNNTASYSFTIKRPFLLSNLMLSVYGFMLCILFYTLHFFTRKYYKKQKKRYFEELEKENKIKELAISQQLIKLNNEKLRQDIEAKNKELATSTMNFIKKNEFLNTIKDELVKGGSNKVSKVVQIIDKNLNNTDDWNLFQEAFNNADKDFLRKIKEKHQKLTPNDLRLCAYLRLNLSSKEIAPLLNISPRSVEVKRYRLRKKMDLPHDANLTNYILEI